MSGKQPLGFIGVGDMGGPMAMRLVEAGFPLTVHDIRPEALERFVAKGAVAADSPKAVADAVEPVRIEARYVTPSRGGRGAARDAIEHVLGAQGLWDKVVEQYAI